MLKETSKKAVNASSGDNPLGTSRKVRAAIRKAIKSVASPDAGEIARLRKLFATRYDVPESTILFSGSFANLFASVPATLRPEKTLIIGPAPGFYHDVLSASGGEVLIYTPAHSNGFLPEPDEIENRLAVGVGLLIFGNPSRITGRVLPPDALKRIFEICTARHVTVLIDTSLSGFAHGQVPSFRDIPLDRCAIIGTTAFRFGLAGLELAFLISAGSEKQNRFSHDMGDVNVLSIAAAKAALKDATYQRQSDQFFERESALFLKSLQLIPTVKVMPSDSHLFLLQTEHAPDVVRALGNAGYSVLSGDDVSGLDRTFLVLSVMKHADNIRAVKLFRKTVELKRKDQAVP